MPDTFRQYTPYVDSPRVSRLLERTYPPTDRNPNWLRARWEYMVYAVQDGVEETLAPFGIWEAGGDIVAMINFETAPGEAYLQVHPAHTQLKRDMLSYAEASLCRTDGDKKSLTIHVNDFDVELQEIAAAAGYVRAAEGVEATVRYDISAGVPVTALPAGFTLTDRLESGDLREINRVLWRGFNHTGPAPDEYVAGRADVEKAPLFRKDLVVMVRAPDGHLVSYCGMWHEAANRVAYVEPVATDPAYRRRGLGEAVVLEGIRRAQRLGATRAIVNSDLAFYRAIGFRHVFASSAWAKVWHAN